MLPGNEQTQTTDVACSRLKRAREEEKFKNQPSFSQRIPKAISLQKRAFTNEKRNFMGLHIDSRVAQVVENEWIFRVNSGEVFAGCTIAECKLIFSFWF